jgi:hypothetical protein
MKKLDCFRSIVEDAARCIPFGGKAGIALISSLLVAFLFTVGCSQKQSKSAASETQTPKEQVTPTAPNVAASAPIPTSAEPKKVVKKRPSIVTYSDPTYGVSFRYPRKYTLKGGDDIDSASVPMDFVQPGGVTAASVEMPKGLYPDAGLRSAFFLVNVNKSLSATECGQFASPLSTGSDKDPVEPTKVELGALEMQEVENISGEEMKHADTKYYHLFQNSTCYEFVLGLSTEDDGTSSGEREKMFERLETILATVKIKPEATPQVAAGAQSTFPAHDEPVK